MQYSRKIQLSLMRSLLSKGFCAGKRILLSLTMIWAILGNTSNPLSSSDLTLWMKRADALWEERKDTGKVEEAIGFYRKVLAVDPDSYEACWKIARAFFYLGDLLPETDEMRGKHKELGREGMNFAERALDLNPRGIEGHYYYALCLAQYGMGISIIKALGMGLGSDYEKHIEEVLRLNEFYDKAGPLRAIGRYYYQLPWPKRDIKKSIFYLEKAVKHAPACIRGQVYLAEAYLEAGRKDLAREHLKKALEVVPDPAYEVDAGRWKARAEELLLKESLSE